MLPAKLSNGFLEVSTDNGIQYVMPSFLERLRLMWIFRNFSVLSEQVLTERQQQLISSLCSAERMLPSLDKKERLEKVLIGKLETTGSAQQPEERRHSPRSTAHFEVRYGYGRRLHDGQGFNYSTGGLAFTGPREFPVGAELDLRYRLEPKSPWIRTRALVRHRIAGVMGVEFLSNKWK